MTNIPLKLIHAESVKFKRPDSKEVETGVLLGEFGRHIIVDNCLNVVINCSLEGYNNDSVVFTLE